MEPKKNYTTFGLMLAPCLLAVYLLFIFLDLPDMGLTLSCCLQRSGEVDVVSEARFSRVLQQPQQRRALVAPSFSTDNDDDAMMCIRGSKTEKVVPITAQEHAARSMGEPENSLVGGIARKSLTQQHHLVPEFFQQIAQVVGDVMIEQELHYKAGAICRATSKSISPRWSS